MRLDYHVLQIPINYATYVKLKTRALESGIGIRQLLHSEIEQFKSNLVTLASSYDKLQPQQEPTS